MGTIILAFVVLLFLFNIFVLFMCAKRWRIVHVLASFFVFASVIPFTFFSAASVKTRAAWLKAYQERQSDLEKEQKKELTLKFGDLQKNVEAVETTILGAKAAKEQEQFDRGRIWNNCVPGRFDGSAVTVATFTPDPSAPPDTPVVPNRIREKTVLFAFKERELNVGDGFKLPYQYLGEFAANAVSETSVTLAPTLPLDPVQVTGINTADATWVLYELMPVDRHESFTGPEFETIKKFLGKDDRETLKLILGTDEKKVLDEYVYDLKPIREIANLDKDFEPLPENVWFRVKFIKAHTIAVDSSDAPAADKTLFDSSGRALPLSLRQGKETSFAIGQFHDFDRETATQMIADGLCEKVDEIYVRPLHNYEQHFHEIDKRLRQIAENMAVIGLDTVNLKAANASAQKQADYRLTERNNLDSDLKNVVIEQNEVTKYRGSLEVALAQRKAELSELYRTNNLLAAELAALQQKIADDLNKSSSDSALKPISLP